MADNVELDSMTGGDTVAADDIGGIKFQRVKLALGADGTNDGDVSSANPIPAQLASNDGVDIGNVDVASLPGTVAADITAIKTAVELIDNAISGSEMQVDLVSANVTNAGTFAVQEDGAALTSLQLIDDVVHTEDTAHVTGDKGVMMLAVRNEAYDVMTNADGDYHPLTIGEFGALQVEVVASAATAVTNTVLDALLTQEDAAHTTGDDGIVTFAVRQDTPGNLSGTDGDYEPLSVSGGRLWTSAVIDTALPTGTNAIGKLASNSGVDIGDVDVTSITNATNTTGSGSLTGTGQAVTLSAQGGGNGAFQLSGTWSGTVTFEATVDDSNWFSIEVVNVSSWVWATTATSNGTFIIPLAGYSQVRARCSSFSSGTIAVTGDVSSGGSVVPFSRLQTIDYSAALSDNTSNTISAPSNAFGDGQIQFPVFPFYFDGSTWDRQRGDSTNGLLVNLGSNNDITLATLPDTSGGDLAAIKTAVEIIDNAISGSEMQVDLVSANVTNVGTFAVQEDGAALTALQLIDDIVYTDDTSTHATGSSKGALIMAAATPTDGSVTANDIGAVAMSLDRRLLVDAQIVGTDAALDVSAATVTVAGTVTANLSATDNAVLDAIQTAVELIDNAIAGSEMQVDIVSGNVTNAGTFAVQVDGDALTALQLIDDPVATLGTTTYTEATSKGFIIGAVRNDTLAALANTDNEIAPLQVNATGALYVDVADGGVLESAVDGLEALLTTIDADTSDIHTNTDSMVTALQIMDDWDNAASDGASVSGDVAHDSADAGEPVKFGGRAQNSEAQPDEVADNDRVDALFDRSGYLRVRGDFDPSFADINDASSGDNTIVAAQAAGKRIAVWSVIVVSDGTVDVRFEDGAGGTAFTGQIPLQAREGFSYSAGGIVPLWVGSAATLLNLELSAAINVHGSLSYTVMDD